MNDSPPACFETAMDVRFRDIDAMGHVNNAVYFTYFEEGRKFFFHHITGSKSARDFPFIIAHAACDYLRPIQLKDALALSMWVPEMGEKSFHLAYRLALRGSPSVLFARGTTIQVSYDYARGRSMPIPSDLRMKLSRYLPGETGR